MEAQFGAALAAQPARASAFTLYFVLGSDELTDESKQDVDRILAEIARRPVPDVLVVGHTDAVGNDQSNDALGSAARRQHARGADRPRHRAGKRPRHFARQAGAGDPYG